MYQTGTLDTVNPTVKIYPHITYIPFGRQTMNGFKKGQSKLLNIRIQPMREVIKAKKMEMPTLDKVARWRSNN